MKTKSKKYFVMFEMHHRVNFCSRSFSSFEAARDMLEKLRNDNDPFLERLAVGYWEEVPDDAGNLKMFHICAESRRLYR